MAVRILTEGDLDGDWVADAAAFTCPNPACKKVFVVSLAAHGNSRDCPKCGKSTGNLQAHGLSPYLRAEQPN